MKSSLRLVALASLTLSTAGAAFAGAPQPDTRQGDFAHVCKGGPNKGDACTIPTEDADCPRSECILTATGKPILGTLTLIAHDTVTDWLNGGARNRAITVMLELRAPDGTKQILAGTYQDLVDPTAPPQAPGNVVAIGMDELALQNLASDVGGLVFVQPESTLAQSLRTLFNNTGTPALVGAFKRGSFIANHVDDGLATVLRFKVRVRFLQTL